MNYSVNVTPYVHDLVVNEFVFLDSNHAYDRICGIFQI